MAIGRSINQIAAAICGALMVSVALVWLHAAVAQDPQPPPARPPTGDSELAKWAESIRDLPESGLPGDAVQRTCLQVTATHVWFIQLEWSADALKPPRKPENDPAANQPDGDTRKKPPVPQPQPLRRVLCRQAISPASGENADPQEVLELGRYPHAFVLTADGSRLAVIRQVDDTNQDGHVDAADARTLWISTGNLSATDEIPAFQQVTAGSPQMVLCALLPLAREALYIEPGQKPFVNRIMRVDLAPGAVPSDLTTGMWVECITPDENHAVVARVGEPREEEFNPWGGRGQPRGIAQGDGDEFAIALPPIHVLVALQRGSAEPDVVVLPGEDWSRVVRINDEKLWLETLVMPPQYAVHPDHPTRQSRNLLSWMERENLTRVPVTSDAQYDDQYVGEVRGRGMLYLHNTNINRYLKVYGGSDEHFDIRELSPLTPEFVLSPDGKRLWFLEYTADQGPYRPLTPTRIRWLPLTRD